MKRTAKPGGPQCGRENRDRDAALALLSLCFLLGAAAGALLERVLPGGGWAAGLWQSAEAGLNLPPLRLEVWSVCRWPAAVLLLSALPMRAGTIPLLFLLRGTTLAYCVASLAGGGSLWELAGTGAVLGPVCLLTVPVLFLLGTESLMQAAGTKGGRRRLLRGTAVSAPVLAFAVFVGQRVTPLLLTALFSK